METLSIKLNGVQLDLAVNIRDSLLRVIRNSGYMGTKEGCEHGECGACTVLLDGKPVNACTILALQARDCEVTTIEGICIGSETLHPVQVAFLEVGAIQCGFCTPGMIMSVYSLLQRQRCVDLEDAKHALAGNLCRCTGYVKPLQAVLRAAELMTQVDSGARID